MNPDYAPALTIYEQIAEAMRDSILDGAYEEGDRVPSVRDGAVEMGVNLNTVQRAYSVLQESGTLENRRGLGFFVATGAVEKIRNARRDEFFSVTIPSLIKTMKRLGITLEELERYM